MLGNYLDYLPVQDFVIQNALAANTVSADSNEESNNRDELGLIAILVEDELMNDHDLRSRIITYAENAQNRTPHSKSFILSIDKKESSFRIASVLEKLYLEGVDTDLIDFNGLNNNNIQEDDNRLIGVVLIGDVPIPVVHEENGATTPSIYPYTDFYRKRYIYNHQTDQFEVNALVSAPNPEIWHGLIIPPSKDPAIAHDQLVEYFNKNNAYSNDDEYFADFEQRILYANYPEMEEQMNFIDYKNYGRYIEYMEEMAMNRYNKHLLKAIVDEASADMGSDQAIMNEEMIDMVMDVHTEPIIQKYAYNIGDALRVYRGNLNKAIEKTGRWTPNETDSPELLIALRDEYAKYQIKRKQLELERDVNNAIKSALTLSQRSTDINESARLKIKLEIGDIDVDSKTYTFTAYMDGQKISEMESAKECGIEVGQRRAEDESIKENNSVLVEANRMYNLETLLIPGEDDDDWELEEQEDYILHAGCVYNNARIDEEMGTTPANCIPEEAKKSVFDIVGSIEIPESIAFNPNRCNEDKIFFTPENENTFNSTAVDGEVGLLGVSKKLSQIINDIYPKLGGTGALEIETKGSYVIQALLDRGTSLSYEVGNTMKITVSATGNASSIDSFYPHVEPTNETIRAIKHLDTPRVDPVTGELNMPAIITPSMPADGIRHVTFSKSGLGKRFDYMNLFRIDGENPTQVYDNLSDEINSKDQELSFSIGTDLSVSDDFFDKTENAYLLEPLSWRAMSTDQKLKYIIPKYIDYNRALPSPNYSTHKSPQNKPTGYEVLHIVADGDAHGYQFGLNRAMDMQAPEAETGGIEDSLGGLGTLSSGLDLGAGEEEDGSLDEGNYLCGDPAGVEIWEWFDALQCWIEEEIMPAHELFSLSNSCTSADIPPSEEPEYDDIFDELLASPARFEVSMSRRSLVPGQEQKIKVTAYNQFNEALLGYIDLPVHLSLSNDIGEFSANDFYIFSGEREVSFIANETGSTTITVTMGDLPASTFNVKVYDSINIDWDTREEIVSGRSEFPIKIRLKDPEGNEIININDSIFLAPEQTADGSFENGGRVNLVDGKADTKFVPVPGRTAVVLQSKDPYISGEKVINPSGPSATQIILRAPPYIPIGEETEIEVIAADTFGYPSESFSGTVTASLDEESSAFAELVNSNITIRNGRGTLRIAGGKETGEIKLRAENPDLANAEINLPLLARMDSEEWKESVPQTLVGSFIGFPAGDFTQEDYFGGTHLFSGKTQAVYSSITAPLPEAALIMAPNHLITLGADSQKVFPAFTEDRLQLQVLDQKTMQTLISKQITIDFDAVEEYKKQEFEDNVLYAEVLDSNYSIVKHDSGLLIRNDKGEAIANIQANNININSIGLSQGFKWSYQTEPEFGMMELLLTDDSVIAGRIILNFDLTSIETEDFREINPNLNHEKIFGGKSINDPSGLYFYYFGAERPEEDRDEYYGFEGANKYLSLFASGTNFGEAVKYNMPSNGILLGDPTIRLETKSASTLDYNSATGEKIYQDADDVQIVSINHFNFNNDGVQDIAVLMEDGRIRLLEGGATEPRYIDRGAIAQLEDGGVALESFNFDGDNYDDLIVATDEGRLAFLKNDGELITRDDHMLNIGKKMYKLLKGDMDQDGYEDLVVADSRGDIYIFYYNPETEQFPENGTWIANYGYSIAEDAYEPFEMDIRYAGMPEPEEESPAITGGSASLEDFNLGDVSINEDDALAFFKGLQATQQENMDNPDAVPSSSNEIPKLPWPEGDEIETYFAPIEEISGLNISKSVQNKDRPDSRNVDLEETLTYTIEITSNRTLSDVVLADTVPDAFEFMKDSITCLQGGCEGIEASPNTIKVFFSGLNLKPGQRTIISYDVFVNHTPQTALLIQKINEPNENLTEPYSIIDQYLDIFVSPPYNNTGRLLYHYSTGPRSYAVTQDNAPEPAGGDTTTGAFTDLLSSLKAYDPENPPEGLDMSMLGDALEDEGCYEDLESSETCSENMLDKMADGIANFTCSGAGCLPMPYNYAFLAPPDMPYPILAFPSTLATPIGPMPMVSSMFFPLPGMASIPGPILSMFRMYLSPTLTGGLGISLCFGPYPTAPTVPPPSFPLPYPPPVGNCMVVATKMLPDALCKKVEQGMTELVDQISSGINKISSGVNDTISVMGGSVDTTGPDAGAGGIEIGLQTDLGDAMKFEPPVKAFSNTHITAFDSLGGVIASWRDRQTLEIQNKLLTLPTFNIYLPDFKSLFTLDFERTEKAATRWFNIISGAGKANIDSIGDIGDQPSAPGSEGKTVGQKIRGGMQDVSDSKALAYVDSVENIASTYNLNTIEGLYDVASTLPLVKITEKPIQFSIPWLGANEIQAYIMEMQNWVIYYEREYARVKEKWDKYTCNGDITEITESSAWKAQSECQARKLADTFGVNFEETLESVKQNVEVLQAWLAFPRELLLYKQQLIDYIQSIACYIGVIADMMGAWMMTIQQQMVSWAEVILTIVEVIKNIEDLFNVFTDFDSSCSICTNERYANFGWWSLLGLILPDIPIIEFPKWPDITFDMSNMDAAIELELPIINLRTFPLPLPPLPYITLPDFPSINMSLSLPPLPVLPGPPEMPELPEMPPLPTLDLPTLPSPPKLPDLGASFDFIIPLVEKILDIWCLLKKSFAPVPEMGLQDQITLLTNRPSYLIPLDVLDVSLPNLALFDTGFNEIRIETMIYLGLRVSGLSETLEEASAEWEEQMQEIPEAMNEAYEKYLEKVEEQVQEKLDEAEEAMAEAVQNLEDEWNEHVQKWMDEKVGEKFAEADKWARDQEAAWEEWKEKNDIDWTYEEYIEGVNNAYEKASRWKDDVGEWFDEHSDFVHGMNYLIPGAAILEIAEENDLGDEIQDILDISAEKLNQVASLGPTSIQRLYSCIRHWDDCKKNEERYFGNPEEDQRQSSLIEAKTEEPVMITFDERAEAEKMLATAEGQEIKRLFLQIADEISAINEREPVDYKVIKEALGVADYQLPQHETTVDELQKIIAELNTESERLTAELESQKGVQDLYALTDELPANTEEYQLTSKVSEIETKENEGVQDLLAANIMDLISDPQAMIEMLQNAQNEMAETIETTSTSPTASTTETETGDCLSAVCIPDPTTGFSVPLIPYIEYLPQSETLFMPSGDIVYSDGTGLYLKRDLSIDDSNENSDTGIPARFTLNRSFMSRLGMEWEPKEAVNMVQPTFTENGAATFTWLPSSNPEVYGYGIELERTITGYDTNRQTNQLADTKIILLPPNEEGLPPELWVDGQAIESGTLVTSLNDEEEALKRFGIKARNVITGAREVQLPTVSNAKINVGEYMAVYFDLLTGSAYSMGMENGFHHIKMTWFSDKARQSTYNRNEMLAPQIYADAAAPLDISQSDTYYMPVYKSKTFNVSDIFADLSGSYQYYWFVDPENNDLTPHIGNSLTITAQKEPKTIDLKLIASQNLEDDSFDRYEKQLKIEVYVPKIELNEELLQEGIISGRLIPHAQSPDDDLSDIPFSVFRKRLGVWKNIGILHDLDENKEPTNPPLNDHEGKAFVYEDSYYSADSNGEYYIEGFSFEDPSPIILKDSSGTPQVRIEPSGEILLLTDKYILSPIPASISTPTRIAFINKLTGKTLGTVYYIANAVNEVKIVEEELSKENLGTGVTISDANKEDDVIGLRIPDTAPSFPGGALVFKESLPQMNIAMIDKDGTIRLMHHSYKLKLKELSDIEHRYVFQIVGPADVPIYDIFINTNFKNMEIDSVTDLSSSSTQIGLKPKADTMFAQMSEETEMEIAETPDFSNTTEIEVTENPFEDLDEKHPYYQQIIDLYEARVVSGYADGSFKPDQKLARAEFIKIALGVTNCYDCTEPTQPQIEKYISSPFPDVSLPAWYFYCISIAKDLAMVTGYGDGFFRPSQNISRAEAAAVLLRQSGIEILEAPAEFFQDVEDYAWYKDYVYTAVEIGLIKNNFGFIFPDEQITRGEFAFMAAGVKDMRDCRLIDEDGDTVPDWWEMTHNSDPLVPDLFRSCPCADNPNQSDTDSDGTRDVCDLDIDNDGVLNPMCIFDDSGQLDPNSILEASKEMEELGEDIDNCIFIPNADQADNDGDGIGNLCDESALADCPCINNPNRNDSDGDGIPDVCDEDIDNDGIGNPICVFDDSGILDDELLAEKIKEMQDAGLIVDNCIFSSNSDQADGNVDGIGNVCEPRIDLCPDLPEDMDGVDDEDGCPELTDDFVFGEEDEEAEAVDEEAVEDEEGEEVIDEEDTEKDLEDKDDEIYDGPGVYVGPGEECSFVDYTNDGHSGDTFMTAITDIPTHEVLYEKSTEILYK